MIRFQNVSLGYGSKIILKDLNFEISKGEYIGIVGPNGSGKTTFLKNILGIISPLSGEIQKDSNIKYGYVPQRATIDSLFPLSAFDIVFMGLFSSISTIKPISKESVNKVEEAISKVGINDIQNKLFYRLSGGQQQRILLARALVSKPDILILDEPTNGLDIASENSIMQLIAEIHSKSKLTVLLVSHYLQLVSQHTKLIGIINNSTFTFGKSSELLTPETLYKMYQCNFIVSSIDGKTVVLPK